ncbi:hypothetical protein CRYUN_Cryun13aG0119500 [Craigia yunnanensis]
MPYWLSASKTESTSDYSSTSGLSQVPLSPTSRPPCTSDAHSPSVEFWLLIHWLASSESGVLITAVSPYPVKEESQPSQSQSLPLVEAEKTSAGLVFGWGGRDRRKQVVITKKQQKCKSSSRENVGDKHVGLAVSDLDNKIASPLSVLIRKKTNIDLMASDFQTLILELSLVGFIVGYPFGRHSLLICATQVKLFIDDLSKTGKLDGVKYTFWDECFTSNDKGVPRLCKQDGKVGKS